MYAALVALRSMLGSVLAARMIVQQADHIEVRCMLAVTILP